MATAADDADSCAKRMELSKFNETWFVAAKFPQTYRLELAVYIICMVLLFLSMIHRVWAQYYALNDWLRARSLSMMFLCHLGGLILFQITGLAKITESQLECWFTTISSLMVVPLILVPGILKLIWFKTRVLFFEAATRGVKQTVREDEDDDSQEDPAKKGVADEAGAKSAPSIVTKQAQATFLGEIRLAARASVVFSSADKSQSATKAELLRNLNRWKFISSRKGMFWVSCAMFAPFIILTFATFAITDEVYLSRCRGCITNSVHDLFTVAFTLIIIFGVTWAIWKLRKSPDPFGILTEVRMAMYLGAVPALIGFILNFTITAERWTDGWTWTIILELGILTYSVIQGSLQVFLSQRQGSRVNKVLKERYKSIFSTSSSLGGLLDIVLAKKELHDAFEQYLCAEFAVESLAFMDAVADFKLAYFDRGTVGCSAYARRIVRSFLEDNGTFTINVSATQRDRVLKEMATKAPADPPRVDIFDDCYNEVRQMLQLGPLVRFAQSREFALLFDHDSLIASRGTELTTSVGEALAPRGSNNA